MIRIAFDVGGVLSKYPEVFFTLIETIEAGNRALAARGSGPAVEVHVISDMHPREKITAMLTANGFGIHYERVHSADYKAHGEACKAVLCNQLGIDVLVDDFIGYVATPGWPPVRLLVMPDPSRPYYATAEEEGGEHWTTDGSEGDFGRRNPTGSKRPPEGGDAVPT